MGVLRLAKTFGTDRLEHACARAADLNAYSYTSLNSILKNGLDRQRRAPTTPSHACKSMHCRVIDGPAITHSNIRHTKGVPIIKSGAPLARRAGYFH